MTIRARGASPSRAGGATGGGVESVAAALDVFARARLEVVAPESAPGVAPALGIVAAFCDEVAADLLDPVSRRRLQRSEGPAREILPPQILIRLLGPCARLFPYQIVAGSGVIAAFLAEIPRLAAWLLRRGFVETGAADPFDAAWRRAGADLRRHRQLQQTLERAAAARRPPVGDAEIVVGRFFVDKRDERGLWVTADAGQRGPVHAPRPALDMFAGGQEASMAFERSLCGWSLLAACLPCTPGDIENWLSEEQAAATCGASD